MRTGMINIIGQMTNEWNRYLANKEIPSKLVYQRKARGNRWGDGHDVRSG
jgi:hypothetical protein